MNDTVILAELDILTKIATGVGLNEFDEGYKDQCELRDRLDDRGLIDWTFIGDPTGEYPEGEADMIYWLTPLGYKIFLEHGGKLDDPGNS